MQISFTEKLLNIAARERGGRQVTSIPPTFFPPLSLFVFTFISADPAVSDFHCVLRPTLCEVGQVSAIIGKFHLKRGFNLPWLSVPLLLEPYYSCSNTCSTLH